MVSAATNLLPFSYACEIDDAPKGDLQLGQVLLPSSELSVTIAPEHGEWSISSIAAKTKTAPAGRLTVYVQGKPQCALSLMHLGDLYPQQLKLTPPILVARTDLVKIVASQPCTVFLIGAEHQLAR